MVIAGINASSSKYTNNGVNERYHYLPRHIRKQGYDICFYVLFIISRTLDDVIGGGYHAI